PGATSRGDAVRRLGPRARRDVARAVQHHRAVARTRLLSVHLGQLPPGHRGQHADHRQLRLLLPALPGIHLPDALAVYRRGQGDAAGAERAIEGGGMTTGWRWRRPRRPSPALEAFLDWLGATPYTWRVEADGKLRARDGDDIMCAVTAVARHRTGQRYSVGDWPRAGDPLGPSYAQARPTLLPAGNLPAGLGGPPPPPPPAP